MAAPYVKRYPGGFLDLPNQTTPVDSAFLNAVEAALLQLLGEAPAADEVGVWSAAGGGALVYQKITNAQIAAGAAIDKSKLAALNITDADIAAAAGIAKSKLGPLNIANADVVAGAAIARSKLEALQPVTALPGSPADGEQALLVDSLTVPTYAWLLQYESGISDANKWVYLGGSALSHYIDSSESTDSISYVDLASVGPTVTIPRAGIYEIHFGAGISATAVTTAYVAIKLGAAATSDVDGLTHVIAGAGYENTGTRTMRRTLAANDVLKTQYKMSTATTGSFLERYLRVVPVRVA